MANSSTNSKSERLAIGLMSGTSLDGLDIVLCSITFINNNWSFAIKEAQTVSYSDEWRKKLSTAHLLSREELEGLDSEFGKLLGISVRNFIDRIEVIPDLIASHGHTVFHQPEKGYTLQIGSGDEIAAITNIPVVYNFRVADVALGGQGAPLVPIGDKLLFGEYEACLNLGGFANISFECKGHRRAFDICPVNIVLNHYAAKLGLEYDTDGGLARNGNVQTELLETLDSLLYYRLQFPKSLGREWLEQEFMPHLRRANCPIEDILATLCEHAARQIAHAINSHALKHVLVTGGGALNVYLIEVLSSYTNSEIILPETPIINYKEALVFALMGILKYDGLVNCMASVTGASKDSVCGTLTAI